MNDVFPFIEPVMMRLDNRGNRPVKIGYQVIPAGKRANVPVGTLHAPALEAARSAGVVFVGFVVGDELFSLEPMEEPAAPEPVAVEEEQAVVAEPPPKEEPKKNFIPSSDFVESDTKSQVKEAMDELGLNDVDEEVVDYSSMYKKELVELAESRGLDVDGLKKAEVIDVLEENDE